jgi:hypothetical protein
VQSWVVQSCAVDTTFAVGRLDSTCSAMIWLHRHGVSGVYASASATVVRPMVRSAFRVTCVAGALAGYSPLAALSVHLHSAML